jgi:ribokinase
MLTVAGHMPVPASIAFVGRANVDLTLRIPHSGPRPSGLCLASDPIRGGKALNQAYAAARLGRRSALIATAGDHDWGRLLMRALTGAGVALEDSRLFPGILT